MQDKTVENTEFKEQNLIVAAIKHLHRIPKFSFVEKQIALKDGRYKITSYRLFGVINIYKSIKIYA